jgi:enoyl-CoA hydratase/3-hydroxyacyl-CoA dehydrogenase
VDKPADLDVATVMAMGFPPHRGGLVFWADLVGARHICARLDAWAEEFKGAGLAGFFKPCDYLRCAAQQGTKLSAGKVVPSKM